MSNVNLGKKSLERLHEVDPDIQKVMIEAFKRMPFDITVLEGRRSLERQKKLVADGSSWTMKSKHLEGRAIDIAPYPIDWNDTGRFVTMAGIVLEVAKEMGVNMRWGGDWNRNGDHKDERNFDGPHFELM